MTLDSLLGLFERACDHWLSGQPASTKEPSRYPTLSISISSILLFSLLVNSPSQLAHDKAGACTRI
jgi:hypothetical protein